MDKVEELIEQLTNSDNGTTRADAAFQLGKIKDKRAVSALIDALKDEDNDARGEAARALGYICDASAVPALIRVLKDEDRHVRKGAAEALGEIGDGRSVSALIESLKDENVNVQWEAARALRNIGYEYLNTEDKVRCLLILANMDEATAMGKPAVHALVGTLKDKNESLRKVAAAVLGNIGEPSAVPALIEALNDKDVGVRSEAAWALGKIGDASAVPALIGGLEDMDVRSVAAWALGEIGDVSAVPALIDALKDEKTGVRWGASRALEWIVVKCKTIEDLEKIEKDIEEGSAALRKRGIEEIPRPT